MADNTTFNSATGGVQTAAADEIAGVKYARVKLSLGADGTAVDAVAGAGVTGTGVQRVILASDDAAVADLATIKAAIKSGYETVAASQTGQVLGASGATGDFVSGILVIPATTSPGAIVLIDNATSITIFTGGASSVATLVPFMIPIGAVSASGAWSLTTGANVSCVAVGVFS
tara:strand:+ start:13470 stop:13988 length:519 start_codon:yes stop_codon:yes gene_type:complete